MVFLSSILFGNGLSFQNISALQKECIKDIECKNDNNKNGKNIGSLTVKKEIFGCESIMRNDDFDYMSCTKLDKDSNLWLSCTDSRINITEFCKNLTKNLLDVEIIDENNNQVQKFNDTSRRSTIKNIDSGKYMINQVKYANNSSNKFEFRENDRVLESCINNGFSDGGSLFTGKDPTLYKLCIKYNDENGNDCHEITMEDSEKKVCIIKNYIIYSVW